MRWGGMRVGQGWVTANFLVSSPTTIDFTKPYPIQPLSVHNFVCFCVFCINLQCLFHSVQLYGNSMINKISTPSMPSKSSSATFPEEEEEIQIAPA